MEKESETTIKLFDRVIQEMYDLIGMYQTSIGEESLELNPTLKIANTAMCGVMGYWASRMEEIREEMTINQETEKEKESFVEIEFSKKQIVHQWKKESGEAMVTIIAPDGYTFSRKAERVKEKENDPEHFLLYFPVKEGYYIALTKSKKSEDGTYEKEIKKISPLELKETYEMVKMEYKRKIQKK